MHSQSASIEKKFFNETVHCMFIAIFTYVNYILTYFSNSHYNII